MRVSRVTSLNHRRMSDFKQRYKNPRPGFGHTNYNRILRAQKCVESRRDIRKQAFDNNRDLRDVSTPANSCLAKGKSKNLHKLIKWKEQCQKKKKIENVPKKPPFIVGIVHHSLCSPIQKVSQSNVSTARALKQTMCSNNQNVKKRITKATEKRLLAKITKQLAATTKNVASTSTKDPNNIEKLTSDTNNQISFAPANYEFKPPSGLHRMSLLPIKPISEEERDFSIQNKSTECKTVDANEQQDISSQKVYTEILDIHGTVTKFKISTNPNKQISLKKLNKSTDLNDVMVKLNRIATRSSLENEIIQDPIQNKSLLNNTDMETPPSKFIPSDTRFDKANCTMEDLIQFSPYLTLSRGKKNVRKEQQQRLGIGRFSTGEIPTKDTVMKNLNISVEEEERTAQYFKFLLNKEIERLTELCKKWLDIKLEQDIPDDVIYEINQAVGQTNLLINKKFERFRGLVMDCEVGKGEKLITCRDLQGFWDMTYIEVRDCDSRFEKLEQLRNRKWQKEECTVAKLAYKKQMPIKKQVLSKPSSLRSLIMTARKKKMEAKASNLMQDTSIKYLTSVQNNGKSINFENNTNIQCNARNSQFFDKYTSTPIQHQRFKTNLIQEIQLSTIKKINSAKESQMCKTPQVQLDDTITYINSKQTPGKSILKKSEKLVDKDIYVKSTHTVNFDDQETLNEDSIDEETQIKLNLSAALSRIDNLDLDEVTPEECSINAEKMLNCKTDLNNFDNMNEILSEIQNLKEKSNKSKLSIQNTFDRNESKFNDTTFSISDKESSPNNAKTTSSSKKLKNRNQHKNSGNIIANISPTSLQTETFTSDSNMSDMKNHDLEMRILRNRTVITNNTPKYNRTSKMMTPRRSGNKKENENSIKSSRKSLLKLSQEDKNKGNTTEVENTILTENVDKKRRSSRKSVAFNAETCLASAENKSVLPMTPYLKRTSSKTSRQSQNKHRFNDEDYTSEHFLNRVTRSHPKH